MVCEFFVFLESLIFCLYLLKDNYLFIYFKLKKI